MILNKLISTDSFKVKLPWLRAGLIFILFFSLFFSEYFINYSFTGGDDPYYHAKHALLIEQSGQPAFMEPWLEFHYFKYAPTDLWWGFHLFEALFIHWFGLFLGVKIFSSFLAALIFLISYLVLGRLKVRFPSVWVFLLFFSSVTFGYKLFVERPYLISVALFPLAIYFLIKNKYYYLFFISLFFILFYHLAFLIIPLSLLYLVIDTYEKKQINLRPLIATTGGILIGLLLHPQSLNYLYVIYIAVFKFFLLKLSGLNWHIKELTPFSLPDLIRFNFLAIIIYFSSIVLFFSTKNRGPNLIASKFLFIYSGFGLAATLLAPRAVEYWLPALIIFSAIVYSNFIDSDAFKHLMHFLEKKVYYKTAGVFLGSMIFLVILLNILTILNQLNNKSAERLAADCQQAGAWLKANTEKKSIVFYDDYSMWPMMFFFNDHNHYVAGVGPTFLYEYDKEIYRLYDNLVNFGLPCGPPEACRDMQSYYNQAEATPLIIKNVFRAKYLIAVNYNSNLVKVLGSLPAGVKLVFKNKTLLIYEII